ncbi:HSFY1 protein, partial [Nyctiprogne leucopyga]|nr:HSFY1 protein [Nyctiprogne leucopyga]
MDLSSLDTSWTSDLEEGGWWTVSSRHDDTGSYWVAAIRPPPDENTLQASSDESSSPTTDSNFSDNISDNTNQLSACSFLEKLWKIVSSHRFKSVWWGDDGNCIVMAEELFREEVLGRRGPLKIFETQSMRGFLLQLNRHGFSKMGGKSPILASIKELQAVAAAGSALGKVL